MPRKEANLSPCREKRIIPEICHCVNHFVHNPQGGQQNGRLGKSGSPTVVENQSEIAISQFKVLESRKT
jgi:hypothetical protein